MDKLTEFVSKSFDPSKSALSVQYLAQSAARPDPVVTSNSSSINVGDFDLTNTQNMKISIPPFSLGLPRFSLDLVRYSTGLSVPPTLPFPPGFPMMFANAVNNNDNDKSSGSSRSNISSPVSVPSSPKCIQHEDMDEDVEVDVESPEDEEMSEDHDQLANVTSSPVSVQVKKEPFGSASSKDQSSRISVDKEIGGNESMEKDDSTDSSSKKLSLISKSTEIGWSKIRREEELSEGKRLQETGAPRGIFEVRFATEPFKNSIYTPTTSTPHHCERHFKFGTETELQIF